jgi:hypothetical protein
MLIDTSYFIFQNFQQVWNVFHKPTTFSLEHVGVLMDVHYLSIQKVKTLNQYTCLHIHDGFTRHKTLTLVRH